MLLREQSVMLVLQQRRSVILGRGLKFDAFGCSCAAVHPGRAISRRWPSGSAHGQGLVSLISSDVNSPRMANSL